MTFMLNKFILFYLFVFKNLFYYYFFKLKKEVVEVMNVKKIFLKICMHARFSVTAATPDINYR